MDCFIGLDLGQMRDYCALSVMNRHLMVDQRTGFPARTSRGDAIYYWQLRGLRRWALKTPYTTVVARLAEIVVRRDIQPAPRVCVDMSGIGVPVLESVRTALAPFEDSGVEVWGIQIVGGTGSQPNRNVRGKAWTVSKTEIVAALAEALGGHRVKLCRRADGSKMDNARTLETEIATFRIRTTATGYQTAEARGSDHDDTCIAVALPLWLGNQRFAQMSEDLEYDSLTSRLLPFEREALERKARGASLEREKLPSREPDPADDEIDLDDPSLWE